MEEEDRNNDDNKNNDDNQDFSKHFLRRKRSLGARLSNSNEEDIYT